jgi:hypothetical protein
VNISKNKIISWRGVGMIARKVVNKMSKRLPSELFEKARNIGKLLDLEPVPKHTMAWQEPRLELDTGDCYPLIDILERLAMVMRGQGVVIEHPIDQQKRMVPKNKGGRPRKKKASET